MNSSVVPDSRLLLSVGHPNAGPASGEPICRDEHHPHDAWSQCLQRIDACGSASSAGVDQQPHP